MNIFFVFKIKKAGFTLIELLVAISIIGIFSVAVTVGLSKSKAKGRDAVRMGDMASLSKAAELYFTENSYQFPDNINDLGPYFEGGLVPTDPQDNIAYGYARIDSPVRGFCFGSYIEVLANAKEECKDIIDLPYTVKGP
jgi:prepilin-type N-terminal cleavage/methylation domain-containing protein